MRSPALRISTRRLGIARAVLLASFVALAARAVHLTFDARSLSRAELQRGAWLRIAAERGQIFDRDDAELAVSVNAPSVYAHPREIRDPNATARKLARTLGLDRSRLTARLRRPSNFVFVARWVKPEAATRVRRQGLRGIDVLEEPRRTYPHGELAAQVLGFANIDGEGVRGIEQQEDAWLRGTPRVYRVERDARGGLLGIAGVQPAAAVGGDVRLTLDAGFQADAEAALGEAVETTGARGGIVLTLHPRTGEILALAERPAFDPNRFREVAYAATRSRAFQDAIEPGSAFKPFLMAGALEEGAVRPDRAIDCEEGSYRVPGKTIHDLHPHGALLPADILRVSSNIGAVKVAQALGPRDYYEALRAFGFGGPTGSAFPFESAGLLRPWRDWRPLDQAAIAFGQGVSVTPVQLASAAAALANGGVLVRPRLVLARRRRGGPWRSTRPERVRRVVSAETAREVVAMLEGAVGPGGTARRAGLRGVRVAGKTGTAQILDPATGTYSSNRYHSWFVGIVPADEPRLVILSELDEPRRGLHHGGVSAAPLFAAVASAQLARLGITTEPVRRRRPARPPVAVAAAPKAPAERPVIETLTRDGQRLFLPDLRGLTIAEVKAITADTPLEVEFVGRGRAVDQEPDPGTVLAGARKRIRVHFASDGEEG
jgi:cell division protein FtsI (penicillin-binding protein 3)